MISYGTKLTLFFVFVSFWLSLFFSFLFLLFFSFCLCFFLSFFVQSFFVFFVFFPFFLFLFSWHCRWSKEESRATHLPKKSRSRGSPWWIGILAWCRSCALRMLWLPLSRCSLPTTWMSRKKASNWSCGEGRSHAAFRALCCATANMSDITLFSLLTMGDVGNHAKVVLQGVSGIGVVGLGHRKESPSSIPRRDRTPRLRRQTAQLLCRPHRWGLNDVDGAFHARSGRQRALECSFGVLHRVVDLLSNRSSDQRTENLPPRFLGPLLMVPERRGFCQEAPRGGSQLGKDWIAKGLQKQPEEFSGHPTGTSTWPTSGASEVAQNLVTIQQEPCLCLMVHHLVEKWLAEARENSMMPRFLEQLEPLRSSLHWINLRATAARTNRCAFFWNFMTLQLEINPCSLSELREPFLDTTTFLVPTTTTSTHRISSVRSPPLWRPWTLATRVPTQTCMYHARKEAAISSRPLCNEWVSQHPPRGGWSMQNSWMCDVLNRRIFFLDLCDTLQIFAENWPWVIGWKGFLYGHIRFEVLNAVRVIARETSLLHSRPRPDLAPAMHPWRDPTTQTH